MKKRNLLFFLLFNLLNVSILWAQEVCITTIFPVPYQKGISTLPIIKLETNYPIDESTLVLFTPAEVDTVSNEVFESSIKILTKHHYENTESEYWNYFSTQGQIEKVTNTSLEIQMFEFLDRSTDYTLIIEGLKVLVPDTLVPGNIDTVQIDTVIASYFTTNNGILSINSSTLDFRENEILSNESIEVVFNNKISSCNTNSGEILSIELITNENDSNGVISYELDSIISTIVLNDDSTGIIIDPDSLLIPGQSYLLTVNLDKINGDTFIFRKKFTVKDKAAIVIQPTPYFPDETISPEIRPNVGNGVLYLSQKDTTFIRVPEYYEDYYFVSWTCEEDPLIENNTSNTFTLIVNDSNLVDRNIYAQYAEIPIDTIAIPTNIPGGYVYISDYIDSLGNGLYTIQARLDQPIELCFVPNPGYELYQWSSNLQEYNGLTSECIFLNTKNQLTNSFIPKKEKSTDNALYISNEALVQMPMRIELEPMTDLALMIQCAEAEFCVMVVYDDRTYGGFPHFCEFNSEHGPSNINEIINEFFIEDVPLPQPLNLESEKVESGCFTIPNGAPPITKTISGMIKPEYQDQFEISRIKCVRQNIFKGVNRWQVGEPIGASFSEELSIPASASNGNCAAQLIVTVRRKTYPLQVERELTTKDNIALNNFKCIVKSEDYNKIRYIKGAYDYEPNEYGGKDIIRAYDYYEVPAEANISITPWVSSSYGYKLSHWDRTEGYSFEPIDENLVRTIIMKNKETDKMLAEPPLLLDHINYHEMVYDPDLETYYLDEVVLGHAEEVDGYDRFGKNYRLNNTNDESCFDKGFGLYYNAGLWNAYSYDPELYLQKCPNEYHTKACYLKFIFNRPLDVVTLKTPGNFYIKDKARKDGIDLQTYNLVFKTSDNQVFGEHYNARLSSANKQLEVLLVVPNSTTPKWASHWSTIELHISNSIKSTQKNTDDEYYSLTNGPDNSTIRTTMMPGLKINVDGFYVDSWDKTKCIPHDDEIEAYAYSLVVVDNRQDADIEGFGYKRNKDGSVDYGIDALRYPDAQADENEHDIPAYSGYIWSKDYTKRELFSTNHIWADKKINILFHILNVGGFSLDPQDIGAAILKGVGGYLKKEKSIFYKTLGQVLEDVGKAAASDDPFTCSSADIAQTKIQLTNEYSIWTRLDFSGSPTPSIGGQITDTKKGGLYFGAKQLYQENTITSYQYRTATFSVCTYKPEFGATIKVILGDF